MEYKLEEQKSAIKNVKTLYKSREKVTKLFNDYSKHKSRSKYRSIMEREKETMEKDSKYWLLNKCFKECQQHLDK